MAYSHPYPTHLQYSRMLYAEKRSFCPNLIPYSYAAYVGVPVLHPPVESATLTPLPVSAYQHVISQRRRVKNSNPNSNPAVHPTSNPNSNPVEQTRVYALPLHDDADGHLMYTLGDGLHPTQHFPHGRYKILSQLGEGTFGKVLECWDRLQSQRVAIKVVRSVTKYRQAAKLEIDVLLHLNIHDPHRLYHCIKLYSWFDYKSHVCMVFEKLGPSLYDRLRRNRFRPFPLNQVKQYAFQLLESVNFVHSLTLIHTDLKPENILLLDSNPSTTAINLIDFGSATFQSHHHSAVISTRHYRAPEVILGLGWTYTCDLWSIGCILVELYTGQALFQTHENLEHLAMMSGVLGPIPDSMIRRADGSGQKYFIRRKGGRKALNWPGGASSKASIRSVRRVQALKDIIGGPQQHSPFFDLVRSLLAFDPESRCTSEQALKHPFFHEYIHHHSDVPITTPTLSSASSACASRNANGKRTRSMRDEEEEKVKDKSLDSIERVHTPVEHSERTLVVEPTSPPGVA